MKRRLPQGASGVLLAGVVVLSLNLRSPITTVPPVVDQLGSGLGISSAEAGLLTSVPVLCFALLTPVASSFLSRVGIRTAVTLCMAAVLAGTIIRSVGNFPVAVAATVLIGAGITVGNVALPVIASRDFPSSASAVTGIYTAAMNLGTVLTTTLTAPLADAVGWRWAIGCWGIFAIGGLVMWRVAGRHLRSQESLPQPEHMDAESAKSILHNPLTWLLMVAFAGQAFSYYAVTAWLPSLLGDELGISQNGAGVAASLFQLLAIVGGVGVPIALARKVSVRKLSLTIAGFWLALPLGLLVAPAGWPVWASLAGVAQGGNFAVIFTLVAVRTATTRDARRMSATVQTAGYACAALGPTVLGAIHTATGGWNVPMLVVLAALAMMTVCMAAASKKPA